MATLILFLCLMYISSVTGADDLPDPHIIGGSSANIEKYPFGISMRIKGSKKHECGGAIITEKFILTAGHCVCFMRYKLEELFIFVGSSTLDGEGQTYKIEYTTCHKGFNKIEKKHDIGLIGIKGQFTFSKFVQPIRILTSNIHAGAIVTVTGWGFTNFPNGRPSNILQAMRVPVINQAECKYAFEETEIIQHSQFCTFEKVGKGTCKGDSGAPVTLNGALVGLVSFGKPCATGKPDVYTKVSKYIKWIRTHIRIYCKSRECSKESMSPKYQTKTTNRS